MSIEPRARLRELEKRLKDEPENLGLRVTVAGLLREAGRGGEAVELYRSVAIAYRDQGRTQQAIAVCRSILEAEPQDAACQELLASLVAATGPTATLSGVQPARASVKTPTAPHPVPPRLPTEPTKTSKTPTAPPPPRPPTEPTKTARTPTGPPPRPPTEPTKTVVEAPARRSSFEETPLPRPLPYHVADPTTSSAKRISNPELSTAEILPTRPGSESEPVTFSDDEPRPRGKSEPPVVDSSGIASAARRITALVGAASDDEIETREIARLEPLEPEKPPTIPTDRVELFDDDDAPTPPPRDDDERTYPRDLPIGIAAGSGVSPLKPPSTKPPPPPRPSEGPSPPECTNAFFEAVPAKQRTTVLTRFVRRTVKAGIAVIRQGETSHPLVVVVKGALDVIVERADGTIVKLGTINEGDFIGEGALLAHSPAPAQVVVAADAELLLLSARELYEIAGAFPSLWSALKDRAEKRTRELDAKFKS